MTSFTTRRMRSSASIRAVAVLLVLAACQARAESDDDGWGMDDDYAASITLGPWTSDLKIGRGMNAAGRNLRGVALVCQDLTGAVFDKSDLYHVGFCSCDLANASFRAADLTAAGFGDCRIRGADFNDAIINGLMGASLSEEQLKSTRSYKTKDLHQCQIASYPEKNPEDEEYQAPYDFRGANLQDAILLGDFRKCDFTDARIERINLEGGKITFSQLASTATFKSRNFQHMKLCMSVEGTPDFSGMDLTGTTLFVGLAARLDDATITATVSQMTRKALAGTKNYKEGNLSRITLHKVDLSGVDFSNQNLTESRFAQCYFTGVKFDNTVITNAHFAKEGFGDCLGLTVDQIKSTWNYKNGRMAGIVLPKDIADALQKEKEVEK